MHTVGVISDTHGLLRPEAIAALQGVEHIIHAGDIGTAEILKALREIAPVTAVRGNNDRGAWAKDIPETAQIELAGRKLYVLHDLADLHFEPGQRRADIIVSGHSHKPRIEERDRVLFVNPGSAGPRRFTLPITVAILKIDQRDVTGRVVELIAIRK